MGNQCTCVLTQIFIHPGVHLHPVDKKQDGILTGADIFEKTNLYVCLERYLTRLVQYPVSLGNLLSKNKKPYKNTQETL